MLPNKNESGNSYRGYILLDPNGDWIVVQEIEEGVGITLTMLNDRNDRAVCMKFLNSITDKIFWNYVVNCIREGKYASPISTFKNTGGKSVPASSCAFAM
jgi:hypothetical protein